MPTTNGARRPPVVAQRSLFGASCCAVGGLSLVCHRTHCVLRVRFTPALMSSPPTDFVTGATGFLGGHIVRLLLADGHRVRGLVRDPGKAERLFADLDADARSRLDVVEGDMEGVPTWADALSGVDTLYHTAAYFRDSFGTGDPRPKLWAVNVEGTRALYDAADRAGVARAVHTSSTGVLPARGPGVTNDEASRIPDDYDWGLNAYFESKHAADEVARQVLADRRMPVVTVLPGFMLGPGDAGPTSGGQLVLDLAAGKLPAVPKASTATVDVRDVAAAHLRAARALEGSDEWDGSRVIVGGPFLSVLDVAQAVERASGTPAPKRALPVGLMRVVAGLQEAVAKVTGGTPDLTRREIASITGSSPVDNGRAERVLGVQFRPLDETVRDALPSLRALHPSA